MATDDVRVELRLYRHDDFHGHAGELVHREAPMLRLQLINDALIGENAAVHLGVDDAQLLVTFLQRHIADLHRPPLELEH